MFYPDSSDSTRKMTGCEVETGDDLRKAAEMLSTTNLKIETISHEVGYQNAFVFSNTFKKMDRLATQRAPQQHGPLTWHSTPPPLAQCEQAD